MKRIGFGLCLIAVLAMMGCTQGNLVKLSPGLVDLSPSSAQKEPSEKWTFWIRSVTDERTPDQVGKTLIGNFDQRFAQEKQTVELDGPPAEYLKGQLSRFLLNRGMEAGSLEKANVYLDIGLTQFAVNRDTSTVLDKISFEVDYRVVFTAKTGEVLGTVRLPDGRWIKGVSPFSGQSKIEDLMRETLGGTFKRLAESEVYAAAAVKK